MGRRHLADEVTSREELGSGRGEDWRLRRERRGEGAGS